jgi:MFS family permease
MLASAVPIALAGLAALAIAMGIGRFAMTPILPMMQDDGLSLAEGGWLAAANYFGYLAGALSTVWLNVNASRAIRAALLVIALSTLAMGLVDGFAYWLALRTLAGVASAWALVFVSAWTLERLAELRRPQLGGLLYAGVGTGVFIAGVACLVVMQLGSSADTAWIALGVLALAMAGAIWLPFSFQKTPLVEASHARPAGWLLILCYGAYGFGYIVPATFLPAMARQIVAEPLAFGSAWPVLGVAAALSTLVAARFGASTGPRRVWMVCMLLMALGVAAPLFLRGLAGILLSAILVARDLRHHHARRHAGSSAPLWPGGAPGDGGDDFRLRRGATGRPDPDRAGGKAAAWLHLRAGSSHCGPARWRSRAGQAINVPTREGIALAQRSGMEDTARQRLLQRASDLLGMDEIARRLNTPPQILEAWICGKANMPDGKLLVLAAVLADHVKTAK